MIENNVEGLRTILNSVSLTDNKFFDTLKEKYTVEDFTGHLGVLLDDQLDDNDETAIKARTAAERFVSEIYSLAAAAL